MPVRFRVPKDKLDVLREVLHPPEGEPRVPKYYLITATHHIIELSDETYESLTEEEKEKLKPFME